MSVLYLAIAVILPGFLAAVIDMKYIAKKRELIFARFFFYAALITWFVLFFKVCRGGIAVLPDELFPTLTQFIKSMILAFVLSAALPVVLFRRLPKIVSDTVGLVLGSFLPFAVADTFISGLSFAGSENLNAVTVGSLFKFVSVFIISLAVLAAAVKLLPEKIKSAIKKILSRIGAFCFGNETENSVGDVAAALLTAFAFSVTYVMFAPFETFLGNAREFRFEFSPLFTPVVLKGIFVFALISVVLLFLKGKLRTAATALVFGVTLAGYVQSMFFNGNMHNLDGTVVEWSDSEMTRNLVIWAAIAILPVIICFIFKKYKKAVCSIGSLLLAGVQSVAFISMLFNPLPDVSTFMSYKGMYETSGKNVIVFVLDKFDQSYIDKMLAMFPNSLDGLRGFTYYPNTTGSYCYTHVAVPYLLTGVKIPEYDPTDRQYIDQINGSSYFKYISDHTDGMYIYTDEPNLRGKQARSRVDNCVDAQYEIDSEIMLEASKKASLYRTLPFKFKKDYIYESADFNSSVLSVTTDDFYSLEDYIYEAEMDKKIVKDGLSMSGDEKSSFRFIHVRGAHNRYYLDENAKYHKNPIPVDKGGLEKTAAGSMKYVSDYLKALNDLGVYENSTIIVTADHGDADTIESDSNTVRNVNPIMFFKPSGVGYDQPLKTSEAPVSHDDIFPTVIRALGGDYTKYGRCIDEIGENEERTRYFYWVFKDLDYPNMRTYYHKEYAITGDARNNDNWHETGKIIYANSNPKHEKSGKK